MFQSHTQPTHPTREPRPEQAPTIWPLTEADLAQVVGGEPLPIGTTGGSTRQ